MSEHKVVLFDVDGVLLKPPMFFSHSYAEERGLDKTKFDEFFAKNARDAARGTTDYKALIEANPDVWQWDGTTEELLDKWFSYENHPVKELFALIADLKKREIPVYLATDQDRYRGKYLLDIMFKDMFDGAFISSSIGHVKVEPEFFVKVLADLTQTDTELKPSEVAFFDDSQQNIDVARVQGIDAYLYESPEHVKKILN